jgi:hypothetical protein
MRVTPSMSSSVVRLRGRKLGGLMFRRRIPLSVHR